MAPDNSNVSKLAMHLTSRNRGSHWSPNRVQNPDWLAQTTIVSTTLDNCRLTEDYYSHISCNCGLYKLIYFILRRSVFNASNRIYGRRNFASSFVLKLAVMVRKCLNLFSCLRQESKNCLELILLFHVMSQ